MATMSCSRPRDSTTTRNESRSPSKSSSCSAARVSSSRFARRSAVVGSVENSIFCRVIFSMLRKLPQFARLRQSDGDAFATGPADPAGAVDVGLRGGGDIVVEHVRKLLDVQAARRHVGGDDQVRRAGARASSSPARAHPASSRRAAPRRGSRARRASRSARRPRGGSGRRRAPKPGSPCRARARAPRSCAGGRRRRRSAARAGPAPPPPAPAPP